MLITEAQGYKLYCEVTPVDFPPALFRVHIFTKFDWAKDPEAIQTKMELFFDEAELEAFRTALSVPRLDQ
jgi:hypothetical protein